MQTNKQITDYLDSLNPEERQVAQDHLSSMEGTQEVQGEELANNLKGFPTPITDSDKAFIEKNKNNKDIQREKIKFTETTIELDGLKFPRSIVKYDDIKNTPGLKLDDNVYQNNGHDYFTFDAVKQLGKAGHKVPSKDQWQQAAAVFGGEYGLLGQLLNYPKAGVRRSNGERDIVGAGSELWSSTPRGDVNAYCVWFGAAGDGGHYWYTQYIARSLVFLQG